MTSPHGKSYPEGCIIFVDPDQRGGIVSGDRVIAKLNGADAVTFKVYIEDAGRRFLKPLNTQYPPIIEEFRILGKVIGKWEPE
jgi:SOS-response transcriptional repressor LexA